jgi:hypothetical protein
LRVGRAIVKAGHQIAGDFVKFLLGRCLEIYWFTLLRCPWTAGNSVKTSDMSGYKEIANPIHSTTAHGVSHSDSGRAA